jgi:hypothetical protein
VILLINNNKNGLAKNLNETPNVGSKFNEKDVVFLQE